MKTCRVWTLCLGLVACGGGTPAPPVQLALKGQFQGAATATMAEPLLLAMGWYPSFAGTAPGAPAAAVLTQANLSFQGRFPVDFTFTLSGPPPAAALFDLTTTGGTGHLAYGVLIAFHDSNGNAAFDPIPSSGIQTDSIAGISVPDPSKPPPEHSYFVVYLDGAVAANDYYSAFGLQQGYNLMEIHYDYGVERVPLDTSISIPISNDAAVNLYACQAAFQTPGWFQRACGIDPYNGTYQVQGSAVSSAATSQVDLSVNDAGGNVANATITLDGAPLAYMDPGQDYLWTSSAPLRASHTLAISVPGRASETLVFSIPDAMVLQEPSAGQSFTSGAPVNVAWAAVPGTAYYDIYFLSADGKGDWLFHTITNSTRVTTPPISYAGAARLSVKAIAALAVGTQGSFVTPISQASVNVTFTH